MAKEKKKSTFWSDFKKFISKGNVVDMAVGVVIGGAFGKIVTGLVNYIINPVVSLITGSGKDLDSLKTVLVPEKIVNEVVEQKEIAILWGTWIQTIIDFLIVAFCIFLVLRLITQARATLERKKLAAEEAKAADAAAKAETEKKAAAEAAAVAAARQNQIEESLLNQEKLLEKICEAVSKN